MNRSARRGAEAHRQAWHQCAPPRPRALTKRIANPSLERKAQQWPNDLRTRSASLDTGWTGALTIRLAYLDPIAPEDYQRGQTRLGQWREEGHGSASDQEGPDRGLASNMNRYWPQGSPGTAQIVKQRLCVLQVS